LVLIFWVTPTSYSRIIEAVGITWIVRSMQETWKSLGGVRKATIYSLCLVTARFDNQEACSDIEFEASMFLLDTTNYI